VGRIGGNPLPELNWLLEKCLLTKRMRKVLSQRAKLIEQGRKQLSTGTEFLQRKVPARVKGEKNGRDGVELISQGC